VTAKISESRKKAFLKALGETGNLTVSAERAKVSRGWALAQRKRDPEFNEACEKAKKQAADRLRTSGSNKPRKGWGLLDGVELVVRGTNGRRVQIARARLHQWDARTEARFLTALAATCNVKAAYTEVGMSKASTYSHRKRWPGFARCWEEAVKAGYATLDGALMESGFNLFSTPEEVDFDAPIPPMTVAQAIQYLAMHQHAVKGTGKPPGVRPSRRGNE
jgi:hypothetical protein